jgi:hypothetical protein
MVKLKLNLKNDRLGEYQYHRIKNFLLKKGFNGFTKKDLFIIAFIKKAWGQDIACLSNIAESLVNLSIINPPNIIEYRLLMNEVIKRAIHPSVSPYKKSIEDVSSLGGYGYYLEHLNIILGAYRRIAIDNRCVKLNERISNHLLKSTQKQSNYHAILIPHVNMRWPADQAAILYSLWLYDKNNNTNISNSIISNWVEYMENYGMHGNTGLYKSEILGTRKYSNQPRGCAHSYLVHYMSKFAPSSANIQWEKYKKFMMGKTFGCIAFREFLPGYKGKWSPDSGPIIGGYGVAATGLALNAASSIKDDVTYKGIEKLMNPFGYLFKGIENMIGNNLFTRIGTDLLASSIWLNAKTKQSWY